MDLTQLNIDFMGKRRIATWFSAVLITLSIGSFVVNGMNLGLDFTGGTLVEVQYADAPQVSAVRAQLQDAGFENITVQTFGAETDILVRLASAFNDKIGQEVLVALQAGSAGEVQLVRSEFVGAQVGEELREQGGLGMLLALFLVMIYVAMRFQFKFSIGAVAALIHDVIIVLGLFSLFRWDFDLTVLAAVLAVIGYSLNDTIVVSDRIRENFRKIRKSNPVEIINTSLNQTLGRTIITSLTTILVLIALYLFGGELINGFARALLIGVLIGTYSSIYVASNVLMAMGISAEDLMLPVKEGVDEETMGP